MMEGRRGRIEGSGVTVWIMCRCSGMWRGVGVGVERGGGWGSSGVN